MFKDKAVWLVMAAKLEEIADKATDMDTQEELNLLISKIYESLKIL